jgi:hypothetical protein
MAAHANRVFPDWQPAPNIRDAPELYELENRALDPDGLVLAESAPRPTGEAGESSISAAEPATG